MVFLQQLENKFCRRVGARSHQILPIRFCTLSPWDNHTPGLNADLTSIHVQDGCEGKQLPQSQVSCQFRAGSGIHARQRPVKTCQGGVTQNRVQEVLGRCAALFILCCPIALVEQHRYRRRRKRIGERAASLERLFKLRQREARIDGRKRPLRVSGHQRGAALTTVLPHSVTQDPKQRLDVIAVGDANHSAIARQSRQLFRLTHIPAEKNEKLRRSAALVTVQHDVAS